MKLWDKTNMNLRIVLASDAPETEQFAAEELSAYLTRMSGYPVVISDRKAADQNAIYVGKGACALAGITPDDDLTDDGFIIRSVENGIGITGSHVRGSLYGVYEFLEEFLGCRFFSPTVEVVPTRNEMELSAIDCKKVPMMEYRASSVYQLTLPGFAAKRKMNGQSRNKEEKYGGRMEYGRPYFVHTFCRNLLKPEDYFDAHPEYYAEINGERIREKTQLCMTNPDVLRLVTEQVLNDIRSQPNAKIFSLSQEDNYNGCTCAKCRELDEYEGSQAGSLLHFVNAVAEEVEKEFPDVIIDTLAYQYTRRPPKHVRARKNVCVRLCTIECCFVHPLSECTVDDPDAPRKDYAQSFRDDIIDWGKKCDRMHIWDYVTNFSHFWMPHPNFHVLAENIRFFYDNNVRGIFEQGCGSPIGGEMNDLRAYIISKALWDPHVNPDILRKEFLAAVYGNAAAYIDEYLETVYKAVIDCGSHLYCFNHPDKAWHTMELVEQCEALFEKAKLVAENKEILSRIKFQEMAVRYLRILLTPKGSKERNDLIDIFQPEMHAMGISMLWERADADTCLAILKGEKEPGYWWTK